MSAQPLGSARELEDEDAGRKFHFPMKTDNLLEPTYFNRKNQSLTLQEAKKLVEQARELSAEINDNEVIVNETVKINNEILHMMRVNSQHLMVFAKAFHRFIIFNMP